MPTPQTLERRLYFAGFLITALTLGFALYLQQHDKLNPCPLCVFQRLIMAALGMVFFCGALFHLNKVGRFLIGGMSLFFSGCGIVFAGRHVWIQHFSPGKSDCSMGLLYLLKIMPVHEVISTIFAGGAECAKIDWTFLSLSLAEWSLIEFIGLLIFTLFQLMRAR